jgi:putative tryptophan/tyrosine transport system substrate-binding protein
VRRRKFIGLLCGVTTWPLVTRAQQAAMPVVGFLNGASRHGYDLYLAGFREGLAESGYVEGRNLTIEFRWADGHYDRLPEMAADLVRLRVAVIVANTPAVLVAKNATTTIPIVFFTGFDPVKLGVVNSLARPAGNLTGVTSMSVELAGKQVDLIRELVPAAKLIAFLVNPTNRIAEVFVTDGQEAARVLGIGALVLKANTEAEIEKAFETLVQARADVLVVVPDAFFNDRNHVLATLATRNRVPSIYQNRETAAAGGLISYGINLVDAYRQVGVYTGRVLKGEKPSDLPIQQPIKFELLVNLKTAKTLGIKVPESILLRAGEVVE